MRRGQTQAPSDFRLKSAFPSLDIYRDWIEGELNVQPQYRRAFTRTERLILFCKVSCGWGRPTIVRKTGIAKNQIDRFFKKMKEWTR